MSLTLDKGRITCSIQTAALSQVLETLSERTGVTFIAAPAVRGDDVSLELVNVPLEQAVRRLLRSYDTFFLYGASGSDAPSSLRAVWIYPRGDGVALRPMREDAVAAENDRQRASDPDPRVREQAYGALMVRNDEASRNLVWNALRGATENDEGFRQRLLTHALNEGIDLPPGLLADLVRADASEMIRLLALDALANNPAGVEVATAAASDTSRMVRERAEQILAAHASNLGRPQ